MKMVGKVIREHNIRYSHILKDMNSITESHEDIPIVADTTISSAVDIDISADTDVSTNTGVSEGAGDSPLIFFLHMLILL